MQLYQAHTQEHNLKATFQPTHCVVFHVARRCTVMDDWGSLWTTLCKHMEVRHGIMTTLSLLLGHFSKVNVFQIGLHLRQLLISDSQSQLLVAQYHMELMTINTRDSGQTHEALAMHEHGCIYVRKHCSTEGPRTSRTIQTSTKTPAIICTHCMYVYTIHRYRVEYCVHTMLYVQQTCNDWHTTSHCILNLVLY